MANKIKGALSKDLKKVTFEVSLDAVNFKDPRVSDKGYASLLNDYLEFEIEVDGITIPVDGKLGLYVTPNNWKSVVEQRTGKKEGSIQGSNLEIDQELFEQFLQFQAFMKAKK